MAATATRPRETPPVTAHRVNLGLCGCGCGTVYILLYDAAGRVFAEAPLPAASAEGFAEELDRLLQDAHEGRQP